MNFFRETVPNESKLYARIRDYEKDFSVKAQIENFWKKYEPYAPQKFLDKVQNNGNFHQRWWEMFLGVGLLNLEFEIRTSPEDEGPDFGIILSSQTVWIEAVAPKIGKGYDAVPELLEGFHNLPEKEFLLRLTSSLNYKLEVFNDYKNKSLISDHDYCITAISSCTLNQFGSLMNFPAPVPLKVLAGAGNLVLSKDNNYIQRRDKIQKKSGSSVETNLFDLEKFSRIFAVLYSYSDPLNSPDKPETTFQLFLNPVNSHKKNNIFLELFKKIEIWYRTRIDEDYIWQKYSA